MRGQNLRILHLVPPLTLCLRLFRDPRSLPRCLALKVPSHLAMNICHAPPDTRTHTHTHARVRVRVLLSAAFKTESSVLSLTYSLFSIVTGIRTSGRTALSRTGLASAPPSAACSLASSTTSL